MKGKRSTSSPQRATVPKRKSNKAAMQGRASAYKERECSNRVGHPNFCDCVSVDMLAAISALSERSAQRQREIPALVLKREEKVEVAETPQVSPQEKRMQEMQEKLRACYSEIDELKSKNKALQRSVESLQNQLQDSRRYRKGREERRKKVRNRREVKLAFETGIIGEKENANK